MTWFDQYIYSWRDSLVGSTALGSIDITAAARIKTALVVCGSPTTSYDERMANRFDADIAPLFLPNLAKHYAAFTIASCFAASCARRIPDRYELEALFAHLNRTKFTYVDLQPGAFDLGAGIEIKAFVLKTRHVMNAHKPTISPLPAGTILEAVIGHHGAFSTARLSLSMTSFPTKPGSMTMVHTTGSVRRSSA